MKISIEMRRIEALAPYARKLRRHDSAVDQMVAVIREFGFKVPVLIASDGRIIDGHLRIKAAVGLGMAEVPVIVCDDWTEAQIKAFRLTANRSATWATWDWEALAEELCELDALQFDLALTGFDSREIDELLAGKWDVSATESTPERPSEAVSTPGDLWRCDGHRVLCGDATNARDVDRLCGTEIPVLMNTDPPYGVTYDPLWRQQAGLGQQRQTGKVRNDDRSDWSEAFALFRGDVIYSWHAALYAAVVARGLEGCGFKIYSQIVWVKQHFALSRGCYHWQHECCWFAVREGRSSRWCGDRKQSTVWEVSNLNPFGGDADEGTADESTGHGTQKPVELMRRPIINHTQPGEIVYDPFLGSGSVLIAAETTGRLCYGLEIDPAYVDVIVQRWQKLSRKQAVLDGDGRSFEEIAAQRRGQPYSVNHEAVECVGA